jgi:ribosomal protein S4E
LKTSQCFQAQKISVTDGQNKVISPEFVVNGEKTYTLNLDMTESIVKMIQFSTDAEACFVDGDPRNLYFEIKNFKIN